MYIPSKCIENYVCVCVSVKKQANVFIVSYNLKKGLHIQLKILTAR